VASFQSDGVEIAYEVTGEGAPVLLIHGFASNARVNWRDTLWVKTLAGAGHRVIAHDNRGHGQSEKLYDPADYGADEMAEDARRLLDHLEIAQADVIGYSMGARLTALLAIAHPDRVRRAVLGGLAANMIRGLDGSETIAKASRRTTRPRSPIRRRAPSGPSPSRPTAICGRSPPACAGRARRCRRRPWPASPARSWWWRARPTRSPGRSSRWWPRSPMPAASRSPAAIT
jgi:pimeloyl-ACP methyl ester carboxylesterase